MEEIAVNEYVRTERGAICKALDNWDSMYIDVDKPVFASEDSEQTTYYVQRQYIVKHSFDILKLIELGDFINDEKVVRIVEPDILGDEELTDREIYVGYGDTEKRIYKENIETIVTKEQFARAMYKVKK